MHRLCGLVLLCIVMPMTPAVANDDENPRIRFTTTAGSFEVILRADRAPVTVGNFLRYVDAGYYDGASFYRTVTRDNDNGSPVIEVIQGGLRSSPAPFPPIAHESTAASGLLHVDGTISMARAGPGTASSEFFICIGVQPALDHGATRNPDGQGFAAFGRVVSGMQTVRRIHELPADGTADSAYVQGQILAEPVRIIEVSRLEEPAGR